MTLGSSASGTCRQGYELGPAALALAHSTYPGLTYWEAACLFKYGTEHLMLHLCLMSSPSLGGNTDAGIGVCHALSLQVFSLPQAHLNLGASGMAQLGVGGPLLMFPFTSSITPSINLGASGSAERALPLSFQSHTPMRAAVAPIVGPPQSRALGSPHLVEPGVHGEGSDK